MRVIRHETLSYTDLEGAGRLGGLLNTGAHGAAITVAWTRVVGVECGRCTQSMCFPYGIWIRGSQRQIC